MNLKQMTLPTVHRNFAQTTFALHLHQHLLSFNNNGDVETWNPITNKCRPVTNETVDEVTQFVSYYV